MADSSSNPGIGHLQSQLDVFNREVARLEKELKKLNSSSKQVDINMRSFAKKGLAQAKINARDTAQELRMVQQQMEKTRRSTGYLGTSIAYLASDMGFFAQNPRMGLLAIGNNLSQVAIGMQSAAKEAGSLGKALKVAFVTQGWMIALQLAISIFTQLPVLMKKFRKETEGASAAMKDLTSDIETMQQKIIENNKEIFGESDEEGIGGMIGKFIEMSDKIGAQGIDRDSPYYKAWIDLKHEIESATGHLIDFTDPRHMEKLKALSKTIAETVISAQTDLRVDKILGNVTSVEAAERELANFEKLQEILGVKKEEYVKSSKYRVLVARLIAERIKVENEELEKLLNSPDGQDLLIEELDIMRKAMRQVLGRDGISFSDIFKDPDEDEEFEKWLEDNVPVYIDDVEDFIDTQILNEGKASLTQMMLGLTPNSREKELQQLRDKYDEILYETDEFKAAEAAINRKWDDIQTDAKWANAQKGLRITADALQKSSQLQEKNKGLAKAAVITNAAAASIGIWRDYHGEKNTIPTPFNTIAAGVAQAALIAATIASISQINGSGSGSGGAGGRSSNAPNFNIIDARGPNEVAASIEGQTEALTNQPPVKAYVVASEVETTNELERKAVDTVSIG